MPQLVGDVIRELLDGLPGVDVVGEADRESGPVASRRARADVIVLGASGTGPPAGWEALIERSPSRVVAIMEDGRRAYVCELEPAVRPLGELTRARLVEAITGAAA